jgi:hypothetical protein
VHYQLDPLSDRVARQFLAAQVHVLVDVPATLEARARYASFPNSVIAEFDGSISLYRVFDGEELSRIVHSGKITGGTYAVKAERAHGASWGEHITQVIEWGNEKRDKRYGGDIFLAKLDALGKKFFHIDPGITFNPDGPRVQPAVMDRSKISTGLGASIMDVSVHDVDFYVVHPNHQIDPLSLTEAKAYVEARPKKDIDLREVNPHFYQGSIFGVDVRIVLTDGKWAVFLNNDKQITFGAKTKDDAIELARMSIHMRPSNPLPIPAEILDQKRRYEKHFEPDDDPEKLRGTFALKAKDRIMVTKGSNGLGIKAHSTAVVADVYQRKGQREIMVKLLFGDKPIVLYATHPNRLGDPEVALMNSRGDKILVRRR